MWTWKRRRYGAPISCWEIGQLLMETIAVSIQEFAYQKDPYLTNKFPHIFLCFVSALFWLSTSTYTV